MRGEQLFEFRQHNAVLHQGNRRCYTALMRFIALSEDRPLVERVGKNND